MACKTQIVCMFVIFFFFNDTATTEIYTLSLHDALPIWARRDSATAWRCSAAWRLVCTTATSARSTSERGDGDRKSTRLNSSHQIISYAVFCLKKKKNHQHVLLRYRRSSNNLMR